MVVCWAVKFRFLHKVAPVLAVCGLLSGVAAVAAGPAAAQSDAQQSAAQRCFGHHRFGAQPVDVAKTADGQTVLAQTSWNWHDAIGCYLTLDDKALAVLRAAPAPQSLPDAGTEASNLCFEHHQFGQRPVDVAKSADRQTVLARLSWGYHDAIGCYLTLDDTALATLRANAATATTQTDATDDSDCHPAYSPCLPNLPLDAINCSDLTSDLKPVTVLVPGVDPYRLDRDGDGMGCTS